jgi:enoyl-CoA hydratase/carnithine racemase
VERQTLEGDSAVMTDYERLVVEKADGIGWLILNRPDAGNAFDARMLDELEAAWTELDTDPEVRVIVNTANGKAFCTGMDVVQVARDKEAMRRHSRRTRDAELKISAWHCGVWKPVIAAVNGVCAGGGLHLVADADIVIAAEAATFIDPHVSVGQAVAYEAITLLRKSPMEAITRMALSGKGERISADRAYQLGIVSEVVAGDSLRTAAATLAAAVATNSPTAMRATKQALWHAVEVGLTQARDDAREKIWRHRNHPDHGEGARAWREKRAPQWQPPRHGPPRKLHEH